VSGQSQTANLGRTAIQNVKLYALTLPKSALTTSADWFRKPVVTE
jgi:hypothetical protein